ncbi:hypothetical protein BDW66DRAFT_147293 [Aspergillus desertorum]
MSADLFAEFGYAAPTSQPSRAARQQAGVSQDGTLIPRLGFLEDAILPQPSPHYVNGPNSPSTQSSFLGRFTQLCDFGDSELPQGGNNNDVLFDATLERFSDNGSDDWGDFESAEVPVGQPVQKQASDPVERQKAVNTLASKASPNYKPSSGSLETVDLLGPLDSFTIKDKSTVCDYQNNTLIGDTPKMKRGSVQLAKPRLPVEEEPFEEWGDFSDGPMETSQSSNLKVPGHQTSDMKGNLRQLSEATESPRAQAVEQSSTIGQVRPTNIPPPSILLELFPRLFGRLHQEGTEAKRNMQQRDALVSVAVSIIYTLKAVARVVAGRTLRWKRDSIMSQSMRIGPARSGKAGGMKLSSLNKNEDIKEQQEAVDIINMWRDHAALFNSIIQAAGKRPLQVILPNTRVIIATASQGAIKAPHVCALCGLKRDERIPRVDENVEDSFGEWWTEHWGHTECKQFWEDNRNLLGQR